MKINLYHDIHNDADTGHKVDGIRFINNVFIKTKQDSQIRWKFYDADKTIKMIESNKMDEKDKKDGITPSVIPQFRIVTPCIVIYNQSNQSDANIYNYIYYGRNPIYNASYGADANWRYNHTRNHTHNNTYNHKYPIMIENDLDILQFGCHVKYPKKIEITDDEFIKLIHEKLYDMYYGTKTESLDKYDKTESLDKYEMYNNQTSNDNAYKYIIFGIIFLLLVIALTILYRSQK